VRPGRRGVALLKLDEHGYTTAEIAEKLGVTQRTVQLRLERIRKRLARRLDPGAGEDSA
jgi:DNA-directed RNA polymerase specialized sigma24 family protein